MCGRFLLTTPGEALVELLGLSEVVHLSPRYNIAPTQTVSVALPAPDHIARLLRPMRWGLLPHWSKEPTTRAPMFNARGETLSEKPAFRVPFERKRCLIPADGFYEWKREGKRKQPYVVRLRGDRPFAFAGLWDRWAPPGQDPIESCTIVTTTPNSLVAAIHDRMPVILSPADYEPWLDVRSTRPVQAAALLRPFPNEMMVAYPVSAAVNDARNDSIDCLAPAAAHNGPLLL
jgi:putative SOS response-associated peptidase YedK